MVDVSDRRREPKGIPTGGRFADESNGGSDVSDLAKDYFTAPVADELKSEDSHEYPRAKPRVRPEDSRFGTLVNREWRNVETEDARALWDEGFLKASEGPHVGEAVCSFEEERRIIDKAVGSDEHPGPLARAFGLWVNDNALCVELAQEEADMRMRSARRGCILDPTKCYSAAYAQKVMGTPPHAERVLMKYGLKSNQLRFGKYYYKACAAWSQEHEGRIPSPEMRDRIWDDELRKYAEDKIRRGVRFQRGLCYTNGYRANPISSQDRPRVIGHGDNTPYNGRVQFDRMKAEFDRSLRMALHENLDDHTGRDEGVAVGSSGAESADTRRLYQTALEQYGDDPEKLARLRGMFHVSDEQAERWAEEYRVERVFG